MGKSQRNKGHNWEREVTRRFRDIGLDAKRNVTETQTGNTGDVIVYNINGDVLAVVQCKSMKAPSLWKAMDEAIEANRKYKSIMSGLPIPISAIKRTAQPGGSVEEYAAMRMDDFIRMLAAFDFGDVIVRELAIEGIDEGEPN